jgi:hypothetical protein
VTDGELTATDDLQVTVTASDPYTEWKQEHFTSAELNDPSISGDDADPDGDGFTNRQEYVAGTDPRDRASYLHIADVAIEDEDVVIRFEAIRSKSYTIEARDEAGTGTWERVIDLTPQSATEVIDVLDRMKPTGHRFYRVVTPQKPEN